jgi:tripartite ATP-independent transporter DctP family solute receptor
VVRLLAASVAALLVLASGAVAQTQLRYAHVGAEGESQTRYAAELADLVKQKTGGRVDVRVFPGSQLGNLSEMVNGVRIGSIALAHHDFSSLDRIHEPVAVFNAPFIYRDAEHAMRATDPKRSDVLREVNEQLVARGGIRIVGNFYRGARQLSAKFPVKTPADLKGKKIRAVPIKLWNTMITGMGAIPTPVEISEIMTALATGLVEGQENPLNNIIARQMWEVQPYIMLTSHMESVLALFVNEQAWQRIPEGDRRLFEEAVAEMAQRSLRWAAEANAKEMELLRSKGVTFIGPREGLDLEAFRTAVSAQVNKDFPGWSGYIQRIQAIR